MKYAGMFSVATALLAYLAFSAESYLATIPLLWCAISTAGLAFAYAFRNPYVFLKRPNGTIAPLGYLLFWPYFLLNYLSLWLFRRFSSESAVSEIVPGVYLGCRLFSSDREMLQSKGIASTLDLTAEFSELPFLRDLDGYKCLPVLDTEAPAQDQLRSGADWIERRIGHGPVFVHCALGHGRSATVVAAFLLKSGRASSAEAAVAMVRKQRPKIGLHARQYAGLRSYAEFLEG